MWECGLKHARGGTVLICNRHSLCGSVDWNIYDRTGVIVTSVTPYVGVWIETTYSVCILIPKDSHSLCGSVDWNNSTPDNASESSSHSLCGSVDWNNKNMAKLEKLVGHSLCGSVDWNANGGRVNNYTYVTPYVGVWIETIIGNLLI